MKTKILVKIAVASAVCAPAWGVERGVVAHKQDLPEEKALYVNVLGGNNTANKLDYDFADRKLFFNDSLYVEPFNLVAEGDTIPYRNSSRAIYLDMNKKHKILEIKRVRGR